MKHFPFLIIVFTLLFFSIIKTFAQTNDGNAHILIKYAKNPLCKIDDAPCIRFNDSTLALKPGKHTIKIWTPYTYLIDTTIFITANETAIVVFKIKYKPEYVRYLNDYSKYRRVKKQRWFISPILIGAAVGEGLLANSRANTYMKRGLQNRREYSGAAAQSAMDAAEASFKENKKNYKKFVNIEIGMYSLAGLLTANYIRLLIKQHHTTPPLYKEETLLSKIRINTYPDVASKKWVLGASMYF